MKRVKRKREYAYPQKARRHHEEAEDLLQDRPRRERGNRHGEGERRERRERPGPTPRRGAPALPANSGKE